MRLRSFVPFALLLALPRAVQAQSATDSAHVRATGPALNALDSALSRYCSTKRPTQYVCDAAGQVSALQRAESLLVATHAPPVDSTPITPDSTPTQPPVDTTTPPDTSTPPVVIVPGAPPGVIFAHPLAPPSNGAILAELPRDTVSIAYPVVTRVVRTTNLQAALDSAKAGDEIRLPPGTVVSNVVVRSAVPVVVRTDVADDGDLWQRMTPARAASLNLATITTSNGTAAAVTMATGSGNVRFALVRMTSTASTLNAVFRAANSETTVAALPHDIVLDRVVIDAGTTDVGRCVYADAVRIAITSSSLLNCHSKGRDAQGVLSINGAGPFRIENDSIEASGQAIMSGGGGPSIPNLVPSDWVIRGNWLGRPVSWKKSGSTYAAGEWEVKTGVETKNARRMLVESNVIANLWPDAQVGFAFLLKSADQDLNAPWSTTSDVTVRYNRLVNVANGFNLAAVQLGGVPMARVTIYDNLIEPFGYGGGIAAQLLGAVSDVVLVHNTFQSAAGSAVSFDGAPGIRTVISGNVIPHGAYGVKGTSTGEGNPSITKFMPGGLFQTNIVIGAPCSLYPAGTLCSLLSPLPQAWDNAVIGADLTKVAP